MLINHIPHNLVMAINSRDEDAIALELDNAINFGAIIVANETDAECVEKITKAIQYEEAA